MFNRGITQLLDALPEFPELSQTRVRRLLTSAYLDAVARRALLGDGSELAAARAELRRLATALEVHVVLVDALEWHARRASAFVAAEVLTVLGDDEPLNAREQVDDTALGPVARYERVEAGLLYMASGFDANAAVAEHGIGNRELTDPEDPLGLAAEGALTVIRPLLRGAQNPSRVQPAGSQPTALHERVAVALWEAMGAIVSTHIAWLRGEESDDRSLAPGRLRELATLLGVSGAVAHPEIHHLLLLLALACEATGLRALRTVPDPPRDDGRYGRYLSRRAASRPLLWPVAQAYVDSALPGPACHAVVTVPTGSGKSAVAELAAAHAVQRGWVLYLAPTRALVGQIVRDLRSAFGGEGGTRVRGFLGGAEYTEAVDETFGSLGNEILVMTPEKCSLALRQEPGTFQDLALCVFDECHLIGDGGTRGVVAELVVAEIMHRSPNARFLLMSALVENATELSDWLSTATGTPARVIDEPWRPTRTLRAIAGFDRSTINELALEPIQYLTDRPTRKRREFQAPMMLFASLQGTFANTDPDDYRMVPIGVTTPLAVKRGNGNGFVPDTAGYVNRAAGALTQQLADSGQRTLTFLPRSKHDSFSVARDILGVTPTQPLGNEIAALLRLARADLGTHSALEELLAKGVAVHTSAMLPEEQRACELAFAQPGGARIMLATSTIAQGLNFPATAVVVGGTAIGDPRSEAPTAVAALLRTQVLNAIGRAGRPYTASRAVAVVIPSHPVFFQPATSVGTATIETPFLREEDASTTVTSALESLLRDVLGEMIDMRLMSTAQQAAFAYLSFAADTTDTADVIARTFAASRTPIAVDSQQVATALSTLGTRFLSDAEAPAWVTVAAHRAGVQLPAIATMERQLRASLSIRTPTTVQGWANLLLSVLRRFPLPALSLVLSEHHFSSTLIAEIFQDSNPAARDRGWDALSAALIQWLDGASLLAIASTVYGDDRSERTGRTSGQPLPKMFGIIDAALGFELTAAAGAVGALASVGAQRDPQGPWLLTGESAVSLSLLPLAIRFGCGDGPSLAWRRFGFAHRAVAHVLGRVLPPPDDVPDERLWVRQARRSLVDEGAAASLSSLTTEEADLVEAAIEAYDV